MTKFSEMDLNKKVLKAVAEVGYETPTPIQDAAIPLALEGRDVLGIAQTGTGKTASFTLPMISRLARGRARARMPRSLVLAPTRELAAQVAENFEKYAKYVKLDMALLIGGVSFKEQDRLIDRGVDVLICTPGRLLDHFERGKLLLTGIEIMVVDEADRMLDMGFIPDIERIFKLTPFTRQTLFFSATMAPEITRITQEFLQNPARVEVARQATTSDTIEQKVCVFQSTNRKVEAKEKRNMLRAIIETQSESLTNGIVFCNRKIDVDIVMKSLKKHGYNAGAIHGDLDQKVRMRTLEGFRDGEIQILVASDVAARGLDIPNVSHVFNYDVPIHSEDYVHRIGRTGRAGRQGWAFMLCLQHEEKYLANIESLVEKDIERLEPLEGFQVKERSRKTDKPKAEKPSKPKQERSKQDKSNKASDKEDAKEDANTGSAPAPEQSGDEDRKSRGRGGRGRGRRQDEDKGPTVIGLGSHVPAFLMADWRAAPPKSEPNEAEDAETEKEDTDIKEEAQDSGSQAEDVSAATETAPEEAVEQVEQENPSEVGEDDSETQS